MLTSIVRVFLTGIAAVISYFVALLASFVLLPSGVGLWRLFAVLTSTVLVTWCVWRYAASVSGRVVSGVAVALPVLAIVGWGYWHVRSYAHVHVRLNDVGLRNDRQLYGSVLSADLVFRDEEGDVLATGRADEGIVWLSHPGVGDCRAEGRRGPDAWRQCYETQSRWFMTWARDVRSATVRLDAACTIEEVPVMLEESRDAWWLWWVPLPHIDNSTRTYFELTSWIDSNNCRPAVADGLR